MPRAFRPAAVAAVLALLLLPAAPARAGEYDDPAYDHLASGYGYALDAYAASGTPDAYFALLCAEYAVQSAALAYEFGDPGDWLVAAFFADYAYQFALADFEATGNVWSLYAAFDCYFGAWYADAAGDW